MRRRRLLCLAGGATLPLAGCLGVEQGTTESPPTPADATEPSTPDPPTATTTMEPSPRRLTVGQKGGFPSGETLAVAAPTVQRSIVVHGGEFSALVREAGRQFVVVSVRGSADVVPSDFTLGRDSRVGSLPMRPRWVVPVARTCSGRCLALPTETEAADSAAVVYSPDGRVRATWTLRDETVSLFGTQPRCALRNAALVGRDSGTAVRFTVENVGPRDAGFRALVAPAWLADAADPVGFPVPEGETVTETVAPAALDGLSPEEAAIAGEVGEGTRYVEVERA
ncbi:MAG: hypothetical protein V5A31_05990 [Haloferacaceae archaeon]